MTDSFADLLLRHRARARVTQRELATRAGAAPRSVQDWEAGAGYPSAERLRGLIAALLETGGLTAGHENEEAEALWTAVQRKALRMHAPFESTWFAGLLDAHPAAA
ncbi:MAG: helix-turn-helix transcriptional regulator, partial [Chloroflexi bacterium]|nr:helix-turn-helix transcriptional regulator [Chloroflexota bacterium]